MKKSNSWNSNESVANEFLNINVNVPLFINSVSDFNQQSRKGSVNEPPLDSKSMTPDWTGNQNMSHQKIIEESKYQWDQRDIRKSSLNSLNSDSDDVQDLDFQEHLPFPHGGIIKENNISKWYELAINSQKIN